MANNIDFYETEQANELAKAYQNGILNGSNQDGLFLICLFLCLYYN